MFQGYLLHKVVFFLTATGQLFDKTPLFMQSAMQVEDLKAAFFFSQEERVFCRLLSIYQFSFFQAALFVLKQEKQRRRKRKNDSVKILPDSCACTDAIYERLTWKIFSFVNVTMLWPLLLLNVNVKMFACHAFGALTCKRWSVVPLIPFKQKSKAKLCTILSFVHK